MDAVVRILEPDGTTPRETYTETLGVKGDQEMVIRNLQFTQTAAGGLSTCTFTIYKDRDTVDTVIGDIVKVEDDNGDVRYLGKIDSIDIDESDLQNEYEDSSFVTCRSLIEYANDINYSLRESDGATVSTDIQTLLADLFDGGEYSGKGQDNNLPIEGNVPLLNYAPADNVIETLNVNVAYKDTAAATVMKDIMSLNNGTLDLTSVEPYLYFYKDDLKFYTEQRVTSLLQTFDKDDGEFPLIAATDLSDDGYRVLTDTAGIRNKFILNGSELTSLQYGTEVTASRATHGTRQANELENKNISIAEGQKWLDGFILDMLDEIAVYEIRLRPSVYGFAPVWFFGDTETPNGYIKVTEGGSTEVFNEPFISATYRLSSAGWDITIQAGNTRPNVDERSKILTELTGLKGYSMNDPVLRDPSDTADQDTLNGMQFYDYGEFQWKWNNLDYEIDETNVVFKIYDTGGGWWTGGLLVKTITSATTIAVYEDSGEANLFKATWFNASSGTRTVGGETVYPITLTNDRQYEFKAEVTLDINGVSRTLISVRLPFYLTTETTNSKADDSQTRLPDAETTSVVDYTPVATAMQAKFKFYTDIGGDTPPDAGAKGWFITDDSIAGSWTRITGDFAGNITGTTNNDFEINSDDSAGQYMTLTLSSDTGGKVGILRYDKTNAKFEISVDDGVGYTDLATGISSEISNTYNADDWDLRVNSADGSVTFVQIDDPLGTPAETELMKITNTGDMQIEGSVDPKTTDTHDLGADDKLWANAYIGNVTYTQDIVFTPDGGSTVDGKLETTSNVVFPEGIGFGFQDD